LWCSIIASFWQMKWSVLPQYLDIDWRYPNRKMLSWLDDVFVAVSASNLGFMPLKVFCEDHCKILIRKPL
jgi:hypothetical protein